MNRKYNNIAKANTSQIQEHISKKIRKITYLQCIAWFGLIISIVVTILSILCR